MNLRQKLFVLFFSSYIKGKSYKQISKELKVNGISSPTGKSTWCNKTIENILSNEKYCGEVILFKNISESKLSGFSSDIIKHRNSYHMIESHPEIISKEDFNLVQELKKNVLVKKIRILLTSYNINFIIFT